MPVSRRSFIAATGVAPALAQTRAAASPLRIVTTYAFTPAEAEQIRSAAPGTQIELTLCKTNAELLEKARDAEVVYGGADAALLRAAPRLKWVQAGGAGMEWMDQALRASPVVVTNYQRTFAHGISETAIGLLLAITRGIGRYYMPQFVRREMKPVGTESSAHHTELAGRTMGIVGMGGIGSMIARRAHYGFDMRIVGTDAKPSTVKPDFVSELHDPGWFPTMAAQVDVLVAAAPHTPLTDRMFNEAVFRKMKPSAIFLAMSRGKLFDDMALVKALKSGWIAGAGLDVFPIEPPPREHPIFDCPNVVMTPHTSGWSPDRQVRVVELFAENVRRYSQGLPLMNVVDKQAGY